MEHIPYLHKQTTYLRPIILPVYLKENFPTGSCHHLSIILTFGTNTIYRSLSLRERYKCTLEHQTLNRIMPSHAKTCLSFCFFLKSNSALHNIENISRCQRQYKLLSLQISFLPDPDETAFHRSSMLAEEPVYGFPYNHC